MRNQKATLEDMAHATRRYATLTNPEAMLVMRIVADVVDYMAMHAHQEAELEELRDTQAEKDAEISACHIYLDECYVNDPATAPNEITLIARLVALVKLVGELRVEIDERDTWAEQRQRDTWQDIKKMERRLDDVQRENQAVAARHAITKEQRR